MSRSRLGTLLGLLASLFTTLTALAGVPSIPPVDAPELAALGPARVGVRTLTLVDKDQYDVLATDHATEIGRAHV